jgi:hypothetical protein
MCCVTKMSIKINNNTTYHVLRMTYYASCITHALCIINHYDRFNCYCCYRLSRCFHYCQDLKKRWRGKIYLFGLRESLWGQSWKMSSVWRATPVEEPLIASTTIKTRKRGSPIKPPILHLGCVIAPQLFEQYQFPEIDQ